MIENIKTFLSISKANILFKIILSLLIFVMVKIIISIIKKSLTLNILKKSSGWF